VALALVVIVPAFQLGTAPGGFLEEAMASRAHVPARADALPTVVAVGARAIPYPAANGRQLVVVSGQARNDGVSPRQGLAAFVDALEGERVVASQWAPLGASLNAAELQAIGTQEDLDSAKAKAVAASEPAELSSGKTLRFQVAFVDLAVDPGSLTYRIEFAPVPEVPAGAETPPAPRPMPEAAPLEVEKRKNPKTGVKKKRRRPRRRPAPERKTAPGVENP
jgi:stage V sporulation protein SpoVS